MSNAIQILVPGEEMLAQHARAQEGDGKGDVVGMPDRPDTGNSSKTENSVKRNLKGRQSAQFLT